MTVDPISAYSSQSPGSDLSRERDVGRELINARVTTRTVGVQLGKLGVSLHTQDISFVEEPAPKILKDFAQEMELQFLTLHVEPFRPAGAGGPSPNLQRIRTQAYARQAFQTRTVPAMISRVV